MTAAQVASAINPPDFYHSPLTTLVCVENTANKGGGTCWDFQELQKIRKVCNDYKLGYHLDGARLWNAMVENNETALQYGQLFDTISVCLSKGLGCPVGSLLLGTKEHMDKALRIRKIFGGGMRQSGFLAAAAMYALDNNVDRLADDHKKAKEIGKALVSKSFIKKVEPIETNIVIFEIDESYMTSEQFVNSLKEKDILIIGMGQGKLRMVTHLDYTDDMHQELLKQLVAI
jgi:threonine aldolase